MNYRNLIIFVFLLCLSFSCADQPFRQGEILYNNFCANCHMADGSGLRGLIPPLAKADYIQADPLRMACIIRNGMSGPVEVNGQVYDQPMEGIKQLTDFEIANIINYINHSWENNLGYVKIDDVQATLTQCK